MGDYTSTNQSSGDLLRALSAYAPQAIQSISGTAPGVANTQLGIEQAQQPAYNQLYNQNQLASSGTEAAVAAGPAGQSLVSSADKYQQQLDPQYYQQRQNISDATTKYLSSYDPTKLTPTEEAQISRGINATTGPQTQSNMNTIRNAQTFGAAGTQRWQNFGNAITQAATTLPQLKSGISGFNTATSRGANPVASTGANALDKSFGFSSSALGNTASLASTSLAKEKTIPDQVSGAVGSY